MLRHKKGVFLYGNKIVLDVYKRQRTHDGAARAALCEQYSALASALAELAGQVYQTDVPDKRKACLLYTSEFQRF